MSQALDLSDVVIVTGGLGPTADDITRDAVADLLCAPLHLQQDLLDDMERRFTSRGFGKLPSTNARQAEVPEGALVLSNRLGTAPGLVLETDGKSVVLLPGVPREMRALFSEAVVPLLEDRLRDRLHPVVHRVFHTTGIAESALAERIEAGLPEHLGPVSLAYLPHVTGVDLRLTARGTAADPAVVDWLDRTEALLMPMIERYRYLAASGDIVEALATSLVAGGRTLAVAESCTGGLVAKRLTDLPGSGAYFAGGVVAYSNEVKVTRLGVPSEVLAAAGAVSEEVARAMALGVANAFAADVGLAVTGIAGPSGGSEEKPVGTVWYAARVGERTDARKRVFPGDRDAIRERSAQAVLALLHRLLHEVH